MKGKIILVRTVNQEICIREYFLLIANYILYTLASAEKEHTCTNICIIFKQTLPLEFCLPLDM